MSQVDNTLGEAIRRARLRCGLTQAEVAAQVRGSQAQVSGWETGRLYPSDEQLAALKGALGRIRRSNQRETATRPVRRLAGVAGRRGGRLGGPSAPLAPSATPVAPARRADPGKARRSGGSAALPDRRDIAGAVDGALGSRARRRPETAGPLGIEDVLWKAADKLRGSMDASEYKHVVLGLLFLKYVDDAFEERRSALRDELLRDGISGEETDRLVESRDEYTAEGVFWLPAETRWAYLQEQAKQPTIGTLIDHAMDLVERDNPSLRGVLPKNYARPGLDVRRLGELVDLIAGIGLGAREHREKDLLGRVYEYFLGRFASAEGKAGGEFYTPRHVVRLLVEIIEPYRGRVYDPCCGSGGMFVQSENFVEAHGGRRNDIAIYGQEMNDTTWRLAKMNLAIRGIEADLGPRWGDTFHEDLHPDLKADYILANPPFNVSDWGGERLRDDARWRYGAPPAGNANFAWLEHMASKLTPRGVAGVVLANGSLSSQHSGEGEIRRNMVEDDLVECIVALPGQLFYTTPIQVSLWFLNRNKRNGSGHGNWRDRRGELLFVDARKLGRLVDKTHRDLTDDDIGRVVRTYHAWRGEPGQGAYEDIPGFCASVQVEELAKHEFVLTPGRFVGSEEPEEDGETTGHRVARLTSELYEAFDESDQLQARVRRALASLDA
ncbi:MAG TPA: N-6 DNA methylase [Chloroflexi bacterium]|nr:N-6 DNA methylase [Chloroflexota bacterium]